MPAPDCRDLAYPGCRRATTGGLVSLLARRYGLLGPQSLATLRKSADTRSAPYAFQVVLHRAACAGGHAAGFHVRMAPRAITRPDRADSPWDSAALYAPYQWLLAAADPRDRRAESRLDAPAMAQPSQDLARIIDGRRFR